MLYLLSHLHDSILAMINQFVNNVMWGDLDYLIIDTPPGTSDEHLAIVEALVAHPQTQAIIVTTPQVKSAYINHAHIDFFVE